MSENIENLVLEHLKRFQAGQDRIERKLEEVITRLGHLEVTVAGMQRAFGHSEEGVAILSARLDRTNDRLDRIERRLELS